MESTDILVGGKCPVCGYDKMLHRKCEGSYEFDGCPKCGFGYGFDSEKNDPNDLDFKLGEDAWIKEGKTFLFNFIKDKKEQKKIAKNNKTILRKTIFHFLEENPIVKTYTHHSPTVFNYIINGYSYSLEYLESNPNILKFKKSK